jgi:hypothetical protein
MLGGMKETYKDRTIEMFARPRNAATFSSYGYVGDFMKGKGGGLGRLVIDETRHSTELAALRSGIDFVKKEIDGIA